MNKIFGDEFKSEIKKLKRLDKKILECKAQSIRVRHICKSDKRLNDAMVTIENAIGSLLTLSKSVNTLQDLIGECEVIYNNMDSNVIKLLNKNKDDVYNFKKIMRLRIGAEYLSDMYSETLRELGTQLKNKGET